MKSVELFAGAGGLALGASQAGFDHSAVIELNRNACDTIRTNNERNVIRWPLHQADVREFEFGAIESPDLLAGGPPCQPFSIGGKHRGFRDTRNLFPEMVRAIRETRPKAILVENVRGLLRASFAKYFEYILLQITYPTLTPKPDEDWTDHLSRLERHHTTGRKRGLHYRVVFRQLNAADYGVPQRRDRVFIVAFRGDIPANWSFPEPTHSRHALEYSQWKTGEYWERHEVSSLARPAAPHAVARRIVQGRLFDDNALPWRTVRDAITDLPKPLRRESCEVANHIHNPGARVYKGHTGSPLDQPAKTLKAGDHGVPGGENMLAHPNGQVRYFTVRESARLQTFPDDYVFAGAWTESMRQLGNAVPVKLGYLLADNIRRSLKECGFGDDSI